MKRILSLTAVLLLLGSQVYAVSSSKSVNQLSKLSEKDLLALIKSGCTNITYNGPTVVGTLCPVGAQTNPTTPVVPPVQPPTTPGSVVAPSDLLNLTNWYLGIPVNTSHDGDPDIIRQPELTGYENKPFFYVDNGAVVFWTSVSGATTSNSAYSRTELRQMQGTALASWSNKTETHTITERESVTQIPVVKRQVVVSQLHDASDDVVEIELDGNHLYAKYADDTKTTPLDDNYALGTQFDLKMEAANSQIKVWYNGVLKATISQGDAGLYWKTGSYCNSNVAHGEKPDAGCEVRIYNLTAN